MKPPAKSAHTLQDIARETGFSISTISRALAGNTAISEDTREVVLAVAARCGYEVPQRRARRLPMQVCDQINVVLPVSLAHGRQLANPFELALIGGIGAALRERRRDFSINWQTPYDEQSLADFLGASPYAGTIFLGQSQFHDTLNRFGAAGKPLIVWGAGIEGQTYCSVGSDNFQGGYRATQHLARLGRRRIAFVGAMPAIASARTGFSQIALRLEGYKAALQASGIPFDADIVQTPPSQRFDGADAIDNLLECQISFDGIVAASDMVALSAIQALVRRGARVPEDVSVIGYDDLDVASYASPRLTTVRQDVIKAGNLLVSKLLRMIDGHRVSAELLPTEIIIRESCGA
ncbi:substrate-binding domain-containing protein [Novosphingobium sp.]|uniref:LacI family DNA-binding transcriptional regulator n=1 Tax=Novosphingobium sp. TaxID=1874826 RepID=UPI0031D39B6F